MLYLVPCRKSLYLAIKNCWLENTLQIFYWIFHIDWSNKIAKPEQIFTSLFDIFLCPAAHRKADLCIKQQYREKT